MRQGKLFIVFCTVRVGAKSLICIMVFISLLVFTGDAKTSTLKTLITESRVLLESNTYWTVFLQ